MLMICKRTNGRNLLRYGGKAFTVGKLGQSGQENYSDFQEQKLTWYLIVSARIHAHR